MVTAGDVVENGPISGFALVRWRQQARDYVRVQVERETRVRLAAIRDATELLGHAREVSNVHAVVEAATKATVGARLPYDLAKRVGRAYTRVASAIGPLVAAPLATVLVGWGEGGWVFTVVSALLAVLLFQYGGLWVYRALSAIFRYEQWFIPAVVPAVFFGVAAYFHLGPVHALFAGAFWAYAAHLLIFAILRWTALAARLRFQVKLGRVPEAQLVYSLSTFIAILQEAPEPANERIRIRYCNWLDGVATRFGRNWMRITGHLPSHMRDGRRGRIGWVTTRLRQREEEIFDNLREPLAEVALRLAKDLVEYILKPELKADLPATPSPLAGRRRHHALAVVLLVVGAAALVVAAMTATLPDHVDDVFVAGATLALIVAQQTYQAARESIGWLVDGRQTDRTAVNA